ncbi:hypothetical protein BaRGS_00014451, partial [Batillaria attramentaria]
ISAAKNRTATLSTNHCPRLTYRTNDRRRISRSSSYLISNLPNMPRICTVLFDTGTRDVHISRFLFDKPLAFFKTWTSPDGRTVNQIDHITIGRKWRRSLLDVRAKRGADAASDHHLVIAAIKIKLKAYRDQADRPSHKYNVHSLKESVKTNAFRLYSDDSINMKADIPMYGVRLAR